MSDKDFIHEVNEDVRTDKLLKLWCQYSRYFYASVITVLILVGGTSLLKNYRLNQSMSMANQYAAALELLVNRKYDDGLKALEAIEQEVTARTVGYAVMAKLQRASFLLAQQKENAKPSEEALKIYWEISSNNDFPT
ncbi:MAG: tetratricopeptide repeat protein, partial [Alphaproteobacteria bacterium]|nr:tetratricopeptide repeat protein [Alphaproteobacteria bacterium]